MLVSIATDLCFTEIKMDAMLLLLLVLLTVAALLFLYPRSAERARIIKLVDRIPGPTAYPIVGTALPVLFLPRKDRMKLTMYRLNKYRPILRAWIGPMPVVSVMLPEHAEIMLSSTKLLDKASGYKFLHPWLGTGLLTSTGQKWHSHRKMITPTFHFKILDNFVEVFSEKSEILVEKLKREVGKQSFNVFPYITRCALEIICETAMGTSVHAQDDDGDATYVTAVCDMSELIIHRLIRPWLYPDFIYKLAPSGRRFRECLKVLHDFTNQVVKERKAAHLGRGNQDRLKEDDAIPGKKRRVAFLDMLLEASEGGAKLTDEEIREEVDTFMFEGHDTTSAAMNWALQLLGLHPEVQDKVHEELDSIFQGSDRPPTMKDLNEMKYLERVIKETLRLYPSVPGIGRKVNEDIQIGNYTVPAGCTLGVYIYFLHRNPEQFPDPEKFDPDNFLPERVAKRHPYAYIPFSAGPRNCIGQKFALLEEKTVLSYILRHYELRSLDKMEDVGMIAELILRPDDGIRLSITPRGFSRGVNVAHPCVSLEETGPNLTGTGLFLSH